MTFNDRYVEQVVVEKIDSHGSVTREDGWSSTPPKEVTEKLSIGKEFEMETKGGPFGWITGYRVDGEWLYHVSDEELEQQAREYAEKHAIKKRENLDKNRNDYIGREEMLPGWLKERIHVFHERGREKFELDGWGYELVICELAALYDQDPKFGLRETYSYSDESDEIGAYATREGTSGNQHDCARALVLMHRAGKDLAGTVAGLSPITGDAYYEGKPSRA